MERKVYNWVAQRSGAAITVKGRTKDGAPLTVAGVKFITVSEGTRELVAMAPGDVRWLLDV